MKKRILSIITALALCLTLCPVGAWAADGDDSSTGGGTRSVLPSDIELSAVSEITFNQDYQDLVNKIYNKEPLSRPTKDNLIFWVGGNSYSAPDDNSDIKVETGEPAWYSGNSASGTALSSAPVNAGTYTLSLSVTLTKEDNTTTPAPSPSTNPDGGDPTGGNQGTGSTDTTTRDASETKTLTGTLTFVIGQKKVTPTISGTFTKPYDGSIAFEPSAGTSPVGFAAGDIVGTDNVTVKGVYSFSGASVIAGDEFPYTFYAEKLELEGNDKDNYTLGDDTRVTKDKAARVTKANLPVNTPDNTIVLRNRREHTYTFDLSRVLPTNLPTGQQYMADNDNTKIQYALGAIKVNNPAFFEMADSNTPASTAISIAGSKLTITTKNAPYDDVIPTVATIEIKVTTDNFNDFTSTITLSSANKTQVEIGGITPVRVPYDGEAEIGYEGKPAFTISDTSSSEEVDSSLTASSLRYMYESTVQSANKYGPSAEPPVSPGVYRVTITVDSEEYTGTKELEFTITKAKVTVTAVTRNINIDDPVPSLARPVLGEDYTVDGLAGDDELKVAPTMKYATVADSIMEGEFDILIDGAMVPDNTNYDAAIVYVPGKLIVGSLTNKQDNPFSDVSEHAWYVTAVKYVYNMGLMQGTTSTLFSPLTSLTRGQVVTILYRMEKEPPVWQTMPFTDLAPNAYYINAVRWASSNRIVNGYGDGRFGPDNLVTREQLAIILYNYTRYCGEIPDKIASLDAFVDVGGISSQGYRALQWACGEGLLYGTSSTTLSPKGEALRAQVAVILMRYCTNVLGLEEPKTE